MRPGRTTLPRFVNLGSSRKCELRATVAFCLGCILDSLPAPCRLFPRCAELNVVRLRFREYLPHHRSVCLSTIMPPVMDYGQDQV